MREIDKFHNVRSLGARIAFVALIPLTTLIFSGAAHAGSDTSRARRAHQPLSTQAPLTKSFPVRSSAHSSSKPVHHPSHSVAQSKPAPRSHRHASEAEHVQSSARSTPRSRAHEAQMQRAASTGNGQISAQPPMVVKKALTTEDFMRAAGEAAPTPTASVAPTPPAPPTASQSLRIDGFGAEGAVLSSSRHNITSTPLPPPSQVDPQDPELASLSNPSHEELAESTLQPRLPNLYSRNGRLIVPAPLVGSHDILVHQNEMADSEGLSRIEDDTQLANLRAKHLLIDIPESASLQLNPDLPDNRRCARPWSVKFATDMARAFYAQFHQPLQINSAARTVQYQMHLERVNGNAAGVDGEAASPHLTGQAIDFAKRGMSITEIAWMRAYLKPLMDAGKLDVEEEFHQACFHISVYRSYLPIHKPTPREVAQLGAASGEK